MFCSECGKQVADDAKFCVECGADLDHIITIEKITSSADKDLNIANQDQFKTILKAAAAIIGCVWGFFLIQGWFALFALYAPPVTLLPDTFGILKNAREVALIGLIAQTIFVLLLLFFGFKKKLKRPLLIELASKLGFLYGRYPKAFIVAIIVIFFLILSTNKNHDGSEVASQLEREQEMASTESALNSLSIQDALARELLNLKQAPKNKMLTLREEDIQEKYNKDILAKAIEKANAQLNGKVEDWVCIYDDDKLSHPIYESRFSRSNKSYVNKNYTADVLQIRCKHEMQGEIIGQIILEMPREEANNLPDLYEGDKLRFSGDTDKYGVHNRQSMKNEYNLNVLNAKVFFLEQGK